VAHQWPNLTILITRMNPDLAMDTADQKLLKSTGAGNLCTSTVSRPFDVPCTAQGSL
jgi:hypothetical protein